MYEATGKIKLIYDTQTFASGFAKREFVITTLDGKFPQDLKFEVVKDKCPLLDGFSPDQEVQVNFDIRGNEYNGKYYVNLSCWKIQGADGGGKPAAGRAPKESPVSEPSKDDLRNDDDFDDDVPF